MLLSNRVAVLDVTDRGEQILRVPVNAAKSY